VSAHASPDSSRPGDALVRVGAAVFAVGVLAVVLAVVPSVLSGEPGRLPLVVLAGSLLPLGFGISLLGLLRAARTGRREARRDRAAG
jgi:hypothetical protein